MSLPVSVALLLIGEALTPKGLDQQITSKSTALRMLPIAAKHANQLYASNALVIVGLGALGVTFAGIATLIKTRGSAIATAAAVIGGIACFFGAVVNVLVGFNLAAASRAHITHEDAARFLVTTFNADITKGLLVGYLLGLLLATILMGIALWRSRSASRWSVIVFVIGSAVAGIAPPGIISVPLSLPFTAVMVMLAFRIWQAAAPVDHSAEPTSQPT
jgi:hypothetical protein